MAAHMAEARPSSSSAVGSVVDRPASSVVGILILGLWWGNAASGVVLSSGRSRRGGLVIPAGWRERASLVWFSAPRMYIIRNLYRRLRFRSLVFGISSRDLSPNSFSRGLWSTATMRSLQPSSKWRALSKASATASASPSTGVYLGCVKREPTSVTFQPPWQQKISWDGHWQCF